MLSWISTAWSAVSGLFGGSSSKAILWLAIGLGVALLLCWALWLRGDLAQARATIGTLEAAYSASQAAVSELQDARKRQDIALTAREAQIHTINAQREALRRKLGEVMRNDQDARDWASQPVPASVRGLLQ
jgi:uncharacterized lipoprotein YajG